MKRTNRILGMYVLLALLALSGLLIWSFDKTLVELGTMIALFCGGYGLRECLDGKSEE